MREDGIEAGGRRLGAGGGLRTQGYTYAGGGRLDAHGGERSHRRFERTGAAEPGASPGPEPEAWSRSEPPRHLRHRHAVVPRFGGAEVDAIRAREDRLAPPELTGAGRFHLQLMPE